MKNGYKSVTYLVVDDNEVDALLTVASLRRLNVNTCIVTAAGVPAAVEYMRTNLVHVLVTDLEMPGPDGKALVLAVRNNPVTQHVNMVMTTTVAYEELKDFLDAHNVKFIPKSERTTDKFLHVLQEFYPDP